MYKTTGIKSNVIEEIINIAQTHGIEQVILFGSRARGDFKPKSDIDLAVRGGNITLFALDIEEINTLLFFDIINLDTPIQKELDDVIKKEGILVYQKNC